jgi:hypothetical protein
MRLDQQVATSVGDECANVLRTITSQLETLVLHSNDTVKLQTKALFGATMLVVDGDFFYLMAGTS